MADPIQELLKKTKLTTLSKLPLAHIYRLHKPVTAKEYLLHIDDYLINNHQYSLKYIVDKCNTLKSTVPNARGYSYNEIKTAVLRSLGQNAMSGFQKEDEARLELKRVFPKIGFSSNRNWDEKFAVDFGIGQGKKLFCAVQVKSKGFKHSPTSTADLSNAQQKHKAFESAFGEPVFFLYYGKSYFENLPEVISKIHNHLTNNMYYYDKFNPDVK